MDYGKKLRVLESLLFSYGLIRDMDLKLADFIDPENGHLLETNQQLLKDAAMYTKDIDSPRELDAHDRAKEALLLWCLIYCQKVLQAGSPSKTWDQKEKIDSGIRLGMMTCFQSLRKSINEHFRLPEEERKAKFKVKGNCSVKTYMTICAGNAVLSEFRTFFKDFIEITPDDAERRQDNGELVFETKGRFYISRNLPDTVQDSEGKIIENPEKAKALAKSFVENCIQQILDAHDRQVFIREILAAMIQNGSLSKDEIELLARSFGFRGKPEKIADIEKDWIAQGKIRKGEIYNFKNRILKKLENAIAQHPKGKDFAETLKEGRPVIL